MQLPPPKKIYVKALAPATRWHLSHVTVIQPTTKQRWLFPCHSWLGGCDKAGASAQLDLLPSAASSSGSGKDSDEPWQLDVTTSDLPGAGLQLDGARVCVLLHWAEFGVAAAGPFVLDAAAAHAAAADDDDDDDEEEEGGSISGTNGLFHRGKTTPFVVDVPRAQLGRTLKRLDVFIEAGQQQQTAAPPCWHLESLCATRLTDGARWWFWGGTWLGCSSDGSSSSSRAAKRLQLQALDSDPSSSVIDYKITTFTSIQPPADSQPPSAVFVEMEGEAGRSGQLQLFAPAGSSGFAALFDSGAVDVFTLKLLHDLGELSSLSVWCEGHSSRSGCGWRLERVEVQHCSTGKVGDHGAAVVYMWLVAVWDG